MARRLDKGYDLAILESLFARAGTNQLPGAWLVDGSVTWSKLNADVLTALNGEYVRLTTAFGGHVTGVYNNLRIVLPSGAYINFDGTEGNTVAIGKGTDGIRIGNPTGGNYLLIEADGTLKAVGDATVWEDLRMPATSINPAGTTAPPTLNTTTGLLDFEGGSADMVVALQAQIPHAAPSVTGTIVRPHVHWMPSTADAGNVLWRLDYKIVPIDGVAPGSWSTLSVTSAAAGVADTHQLSSFGNINLGTDPGLSCMLLMKLTRRASVTATDTYPGNAQLMEFDIHYPIDTLGSRTELTK